MSGRLRDSTATLRLALHDGWEMLATAAGAVDEPLNLPAAGWLPCTVPSTAAAVLASHGRFDLDGPGRQFDAEDWWWRVRFSLASAPDESTVLCLDGLATIADVWLNGRHVLHSENMFLAHEIDFAPAAENDLVIRFRALTPLLGVRRPRPRWRVPMLEQQQLRWFRTTLLGRTPGWSPPAPAVGPWREVRVEQRRDFTVGSIRLRSRVADARGTVDFSCDFSSRNVRESVRADLVLQRDGRQHRVRLSHSEGRLSGSLSLPEPALWWPHTHGEPALYEARLEFSAGAATHELCLGSIGFRSVEVMTANGDFSVRVNGQPIFCRGACWTPVDALALHSTRERLGPIFDRAVAAGMNMLRVGGTMVYESDAFYDLCDERGLLVWQDFMFANMDYPEEESFQKSVEQEALQVLARLQARPSLAILCGSSEGEQQAAMWGAPRELWSPPLFHGLLKQLAQQRCDDVPYWPSSAHGGAFPHQASAGTCSYYGVGAYLRPLEDARLSQVRFASECLAFANIPEGDARPGGPTARVHHPAWKARTPRDLGAGWDFDDVRDHYLGRLFRLDPVALRSSDHERFLALGSVVSGEVMAHVFSEWRRAGSHCSGGLVWFLKDFWPSAGWGILDANARPKAAYWYLRRALQPLTVSLADEGVNGLFAHLVNERADAQDVELEVRSFKDGETPLGQFRRGFHVEPRATLEIPIATLLEGFSDLTYAYRFGPPGCNLVVASLLAGGARVAEAFYFPLGLPNAVEPDVGLTAELRPISATQSELTVRSRRLAYAVHLELPGALPEDDYFNVAPAGERRISIRHELPFSELRGRLLAHNAAASVRVSAPAGAVVS